MCDGCSAVVNSPGEKMVVVVVVAAAYSSSLAERPFLSHSLASPSGFHYFGFRNDFFFWKRKVDRFASNPQPVGPGLCIYDPQWQGDPVLPPGTGFHIRRLPRLAGLRWRYFNPPQVLILRDSIMWMSAHMFDTPTHGLNGIFLSDYYRNDGINNRKFEQTEVHAVEN
jgi:hypothetical protein